MSPEYCICTSTVEPVSIRHYLNLFVGSICSDVGTRVSSTNITFQDGVVYCRTVCLL